MPHADDGVSGQNASNDGCPVDTDDDGTPDADDACPLVYGPASNNGCPEPGQSEPEVCNGIIRSDVKGRSNSTCAWRITEF